jgi:hypothetical protein
MQQEGTNGRSLAKYTLLNCDMMRLQSDKDKKLSERKVTILAGPMGLAFGWTDRTLGKIVSCFTKIK